MSGNRTRDEGKAVNGQDRITIRPLCPGDGSAVAALERQIFGSPWSEKTVADSIEQANRYLTEREGTTGAAWGAFGAFEDGVLVGYFFSAAAAGEGELHRIAVAPEKRRLGLGDALMERFLDWLSENGAGTAFLEVRSGNDAAVSLYEKHGFSEIGRRRNYYKNPCEDARIFQYL